MAQKSLRERIAAGNDISAEEAVSGTVAEIEDIVSGVEDPDDLDAIEKAEAAGQNRTGVKDAIARRRQALDAAGGDDEEVDEEATDTTQPDAVKPGEPVGDATLGVNPTQNTQLLTTTDDLEREVRVGRLTPEQAGRPDLRVGEPVDRTHEYLSTEVADDRQGVDQPLTDVSLAQSAWDGDPYTEMGTAFRWAMRQLMHPAEQTRTCPQHGRVPMTHMCSHYKDDNYAAAIKLLKELGEEID